MVTGLFWADPERRLALHMRIAQAAAQFRCRFNREPNLCLVPRGEVSRPRDRLGGVIIRPCQGLPPHHIWIGVEEPPGGVTG